MNWMGDSNNNLAQSPTGQNTVSQNPTGSNMANQASAIQTTASQVSVATNANITSVLDSVLSSNGKNNSQLDEAAAAMARVAERQERAKREAAASKLKASKPKFTQGPEAEREIRKKLKAFGALRLFCRGNGIKNVYLASYGKADPLEGGVLVGVTPTHLSFSGAKDEPQAFAIFPARVTADGVKIISMNYRIGDKLDDYSLKNLRLSMAREHRADGSWTLKAEPSTEKPQISSAVKSQASSVAPKRVETHAPKGTELKSVKEAQREYLDSLIARYGALGVSPRESRISDSCYVVNLTKSPHNTNGCVLVVVDQYSQVMIDSLEHFSINEKTQEISLVFRGIEFRVENYAVLEELQFIDEFLGEGFDGSYKDVMQKMMPKPEPDLTQVRPAPLIPHGAGAAQSNQQPSGPSSRQIWDAIMNS